MPCVDAARDLGTFAPPHLSRPAPVVTLNKAATLRLQANAARAPLTPGSLASLAAASAAPTPPRSAAATPRSSITSGIPRAAASPRPPLAKQTACHAAGAPPQSAARSAAHAAGGYAGAGAAHRQVPSPRKECAPPATACANGKAGARRTGGAAPTAQPKQAAPSPFHGMSQVQTVLLPPSVLTSPMGASLQGSSAAKADAQAEGGRHVAREAMSPHTSAHVHVSPDIAAAAAAAFDAVLQGNRMQLGLQQQQQQQQQQLNEGQMEHEEDAEGEGKRHGLDEELQVCFCT